MLRTSCILALLILSGCAAQPPQPVPDSRWQSHSAALTELTHWEFRGRVAVRGSDFADSARLEWTQTAKKSRLVLSGPMGWQQVTLLNEAGYLSMQRDGEWTTLSGSAELERLLGWELPAEQLAWWVRGLPAPAPEPTVIELDAGRLGLLSQDGWQLRYEEYQQVQGRALPRRILFQRGELSGKMILKSWELAP